MQIASHVSRTPVHAPALRLDDYVVEPGRELERLMDQAGKQAGIPHAATKALAQGALLLALMARTNPALPEEIALGWLAANNNEGVPSVRRRTARQLPVLLYGVMQMFRRDVAERPS